MRVLVQWATATVADWVQYDITNLSDVRAMPKKPEPGDSPLIDDQPGWAAAINLQGVILEGDHVGFDIDGTGAIVAGCWNDDPADWPFPWGVLRTFGQIAPDPALPVSPEYAAANPDACGQIGADWFLLNTQQTATLYANTADLQAYMAAAPNHTEYAWAERMLNTAGRAEFDDWPRFNKQNIIHGVWLDQPLWDALTAARTPHGWEEWRPNG